MMDFYVSCAYGNGYEGLTLTECWDKVDCSSHWPTLKPKLFPLRRFMVLMTVSGFGELFCNVSRMTILFRFMV